VAVGVEVVPSWIKGTGFCHVLIEAELEINA